ncbi:hypothetical protein U1Q18_019418 [Sarracenia purpurea var. burkii]
MLDKLSLRLVLDFPNCPHRNIAWIIFNPNLRCFFTESLSLDQCHRFESLNQGSDPTVPLQEFQKTQTPSPEKSPSLSSNSCWIKHQKHAPFGFKGPKKIAANSPAANPFRNQQKYSCNSSLFGVAGDGGEEKDATGAPSL